MNRLNTVPFKANPASISECLGYNYGDLCSTVYFALVHMEEAANLLF